LLPGERIICLSSQYPKPVRRSGTRSGQLLGFLFGLAPDGVFRAFAITREAVGSYPTFSPLPPAEAGGGLIFCGTVRRKALSLPPEYIPCPEAKVTRPSRPAEFGLSSPGSRRERFSTLPKSSIIITPGRADGKLKIKGCHGGPAMRRRWSAPISPCQNTFTNSLADLPATRLAREMISAPVVKAAAKTSASIPGTEPKGIGRGENGKTAKGSRIRC